ncbi:glycosyl transferase [Campylobacterota bacterium]|nr:glycosyl transferase [Campylobacterota bacterium]
MREINGISVVIPALNEQDAIGSTIADIAQILDQWGGGEGKTPYEIIVIDDGSQDETAANAANAGAKVVSHPTNAGYGRSLKDGIIAAKYDCVAMCDADGTYPIKDLPLLLEKYLAGFDMAVGARTGDRYRQSPFKSVLRFLLKSLVEWTTGKKIPDINSGFRVFGKKEALPFFRHLCDTFSFTTSITLAYMMNGLFVAYIPTEYYARVGSSKVRLFSDSLRTIGYVMRQILYFDPLKIFILFSASWLFFAFWCFVLTATTGILLGYNIGVFSIFGSFIMLGLGLLAEQIRQLIVSMNDRKGEI